MKDARFCLGLFALSATAVGCAAQANPAATANATPAEERASVLYQVDARRALPLPLVRGSVSGKPTWMVVDTGTGGTVVASWLARSLGLETTKVSEPTRDPSGRPVTMERCDAPHLVIDGFRPLIDRPTPVVDLPAPFESAGIGVILSPQALATGDFEIILDMPRHELRRARSREPGSAVDASEHGFDIEHPVVCPNQEPATFINRRLTATARIDGISTVLEVDTGAFGSPLFLMADTDVGHKVLARPERVGETGMSAAGKLDVVTAQSVPVHVGNQDRLANVTVMPGARDARCGVDGRLGLEWLRTCVFVIREKEYRLRCNNDG
jgi:hypothetical protein